jgi:uncharacterized BrkB/YihY/UPF0761 family membrane protein
MANHYNYHYAYDYGILWIPVHISFGICCRRNAMITISAHLIAYIATLLVVSALLLLSLLFPSFSQWLTKLTVFGAAKTNECVALVVISIICYLIFMVIFSGTDKENRYIQKLTQWVLIASLAFICFVVVAITLSFFIA